MVVHISSCSWFFPLRSWSDAREFVALLSFSQPSLCFAIKVHGLVCEFHGAPNKNSGVLMIFTYPYRNIVHASFWSLALICSATEFYRNLVRNLNYSNHLARSCKYVFICTVFWFALRFVHMLSNAFRFACWTQGDRFLLIWRLGSTDLGDQSIPCWPGQ